MTSIFGDRVIIESLTKPADGAIVITLCPLCRRIEIAHSPYACPPVKDGHNAWLFTWECLKCFRFRPPTFEFPRDKFFRPYAVFETERRDEAD